MAFKAGKVGPATSISLRSSFRSSGNMKVNGKKWTQDPFETHQDTMIPKPPARLPAVAGKGFDKELEATIKRRMRSTSMLPLPPEEPCVNEAKKSIRRYERAMEVRVLGGAGRIMQVHM